MDSQGTRVMAEVETVGHAADSGNKGQVRLVFVSQQITPVVLAAHQYVGQIDSLELLATTSMQGRASELKRAVERIAADRHIPIPLAIRKIKHDDEATPSQLREDILRHAMAAHEAHPDSLLVFDLTGGTKMMALAMYMVAEILREQGFSVRVTYTNTGADAFQWISPELADEPMHVELPARDLLQANAFQIDAIRSDDDDAFRGMCDRRELTERVMAMQSSQVIGVLNGWAQCARKSLGKGGARTPYRVRRDDPSSSGPLPVSLLGQLKAAGALDFGLGPDNRPAWVDFNSLEWASYLSGEWLEEWAWWQVENIPGIKSQDLGVQVRRRDVPNELDLVLSSRNRMLVIEVKTGALMAGNNRDAKESDVLYKVDALLHKLSPLFGAALLLSWQPLSDAALKRARDGRLCVLANAASGNNDDRSPQSLSKVVRQWVETGKLPRQA